MAEVLGIVGSSIAVANSAATLSRALFDVVETIKNARKEIVYIAQQLSLLSGSLHVLADVINSSQNVYKPALYENTTLIIRQYKKVESELKTLLDTPGMLVRLTWCIKKTKVKSLLREIEAIKTLLTLELNIVQLAREEGLRILPDCNAATKSIPRPNRFRRLVESTVQANRQVIESAQRTDAEQNTHRSDQFRAEVDIYREGSFDTATWLYHLVFSPREPSSPEHGPLHNDSLYQASVSDEGVERTVRLIRTPPGSASAPKVLNVISHANKAMIVWSKQTEPSRVVDRLLSCWTTLTDEQIALSATRSNDDEWRETVLKRAEKMREEEKDIEKQQEEHSSDNTGDDDFESTEKESVSDEYSSAYRTNRSFHLHESGHPYSLNGRTATIPEVKSESSSHARKTRNNKQPLRQNDPWAVPESNPSGNVHHASFRPAHRKISRSKQHQRSDDPWLLLDSKLSDNVHRAPFRPAHGLRPKRNGPVLKEAAHRSYSMFSEAPLKSRPSTHASSNTFLPYEPFSNNIAGEGRASVSAGYQPSYAPWPQWPSQTYNSASLRSATNSIKSPDEIKDHVLSTNAEPPPVSSRPSQMVDISQESVTVSKNNQKEEAILAAVTQLLDKSSEARSSSDNDPRFAQLLDLLVKQQEDHTQLELDRTKAIAEVEMKSILAARDKDGAALERLEKLLLQEREEQRQSQAIWRAERLAQDEKAAEQVQEAKKLVERKINAAQAAEQAARKSLEFAKAEAKKKAKAEAEERVRQEREMHAHKINDVIERYEKAFEIRLAQQSQTQPSVGLPVRRTLMADGVRTIEVAEYSADMTDPDIMSSPSSAAWFQEGMSLSKTFPQGNRPRLWLSQHCHEPLDGPAAVRQSFTSSPVSSRNASAPNMDQQTIVFPSKVDPRSAKISELQSSLANIGVNARFQDAEFDTIDEVSQSTRSNIEVVQSSIFWDAPSLGSGSELLATYRRSGWRPPYARSSDSGHTYFLGSQPVHSYFFRPDYKPQFLPDEASSRSSSVIIDQALVHVYALQESGLEYESNEAGAYILDGRLQYSEIEALIERSFSMRETHFRATFRRLQWHKSVASHNSGRGTSPRKNDLFTLSTQPESVASVANSHTSRTESETCSEGEEGKQEKAYAVKRFRQLDSEAEGPASLHRDTASNATRSLASLSSRSSNPFRRRIEEAEEKAKLI